MKTPSLPRMKEVADRAGVSTATVSRAMSQPQRVSAEVRKRIEAAIRELGYTINTAARSLRRNDTSIILVIVPDIGNTFFSILLKGIEQQARELGYAVLIVDADDDDAAQQRTALSQLQTHRADGAIVLNGRKVGGGAETAFGGVKHVSNGDFIPVIAISERVPGGTVPLVGIDNVAAARSAVDHLIGRGHRCIAHVAGPPGNPLTADRLSGYRMALAAAGIAFDESFLVHGDFSVESGRRACRKLLDGGQPVTAVFASNDAMAIGIVAECRAHGVLVPERLSVVGFDDIEMAAVFNPSITTVRQPRYEMGRTAMMLLAEAIKFGTMPDHDVLLSTEFIVRDSVAPPRM
jgi:LacI family repressor for deo operon, udp, cdd, tsx, nupC, and nupG